MHPISFLNAFIDLPKEGLGKTTLRLGVTLLRVYHRGHWWWKKSKMYSKIDNFLPLLAGHALRLVCGAKIVKVTAKLFLLLTRIEKCQKKCWGLQKEFKQIEYSVYLYRSWLKRRHFHIHNAVSNSSYPLKKLICDIIQHILHIFHRFLKLGFALWDSYEALYADEEALCEVFIHGSTWLDYFYRHKDHVIQFLENRKPLLQRTFRILHLEGQVDEFIDTLKAAVNTFDQISRPIIETAKVLNEKVTEFFNELFEPMFVLNSQNSITQESLNPSTCLGIAFYG